MKKTFNYISYCIYSFIPLYFVLLIYTIIKQDLLDTILCLVLILYSIFSLLLLMTSRPSDVFVCSNKELKKQRGIDYGYLILMIIMTFLIINEKLYFSFKLTFLLIIFFILFKILFKYKNYSLTLLGYKMYFIRDKIIYSKKNEEELNKFLKEKKFLQIIKISDNIFLEIDKYGMTKYYCKDC